MALIEKIDFEIRPPEKMETETFHEIGKELQVFLADERESETLVVKSSGLSAEGMLAEHFYLRVFPIAQKTRSNIQKVEHRLIEGGEEPNFLGEEDLQQAWVGYKNYIFGKLFSEPASKDVEEISKNILRLCAKEYTLLQPVDWISDKSRAQFIAEYYKGDLQTISILETFSEIVPDIKKSVEKEKREMLENAQSID